jgi:hypothetical protein
MEYVCDAPHGTWFRLETESEAMQESVAMHHAVEKYFRRAYRDAADSYVPAAGLSRIEQSIGLKSYIARTMPMFLTLRDNEGNALITAMLPPGGKPRPNFESIVVGSDNSDPYLYYEASIEALAVHVGLPLEADDCYPYRRH